MTYLPALVLVLFFTLPLPASAADYRGECSIVFHGKSTLHDFSGKARCQPFVAKMTDGAVDLPQVSVAVAEMDTDNGKRDRKMREMFEAQKFPLITGSAGTVSLRDLRDLQKGGADGAARVNLKLKIRDTVRPVAATVTNYSDKGSRITAEVTFTLSLADYQLKPPSVLGMIKVDDKVSATATVVLNEQ